jgi:hypothetical protein
VGEDVVSLAEEIKMNPITLNRALQRMRSNLDQNHPTWRLDDFQAPPPQAPKVLRMYESAVTKERPLPTPEELFAVIRKGSSLSALSRLFDRSEATIQGLVDGLKSNGYMVEQEQQMVKVATEYPKQDYSPARTLADEMGQDVLFAVASDTHAGSTHSQPSALLSFIQKAYAEGIRHVFVPGDITAGVGGYRGQENDIIPPIRPFSRQDYPRTTEAEIELADTYLPKLDGLKYYLLGGNHDAWHIVNCGIDAVARLCNRREDTFYMGYDIADIPLTDRVAVRIWHPSGSSPYSLSYRIQKGLEQMAFDELTRAIEENDNPKVRFLLAGHLHTEVKFHRGPMVAAHVGCFEGQTNYLKRKGLYPTIGGAIFKVRLTDNGLVQRVGYDFIPFLEVQDDWMNFPAPGREEAYVAEQVDTLFKVATA